MRFLFPGVACALTAAAVVSVSPDARAYCRTTTVAVPAGYDPTQSGCYTEGTPLAWAPGRAPYGVVQAASKQVPLQTAMAIADKAFGVWNEAHCQGGVPSLQTYDDGPISSVPEGSDCQTSDACDPSTHDTISFDDGHWPYDDPANTLALTTVTYGMNDGRIFEARTEVNSAMHKLTTTEPPPAGGATYDLQAILTHEAGHFVGLAHATSTTSIMYAYYQPGAIKLTTDDVDAVCAVYPPGEIPTTSGSGKGCTLARSGGPPASPALPLGGLALLVLTGARTARRARRRVS